MVDIMAATAAAAASNKSAERRDSRLIGDLQAQDAMECRRVACQCRGTRQSRSLLRPSRQRELLAGSVPNLVHPVILPKRPRASRRSPCSATNRREFIRAWGWHADRAVCAELAEPGLCQSAAAQAAAGGHVQPQRRGPGRVLARRGRARSSRSRNASSRSSRSASER